MSASATLAVDAAAKALQAAGEHVIGFGAGEPDFPTPRAIVEAAEAACANPIYHHYTPTAGLPALRSAIRQPPFIDGQPVSYYLQQILPGGLVIWSWPRRQRGRPGGFPAEEGPLAPHYIGRTGLAGDLVSGHDS